MVGDACALLPPPTSLPCHPHTVGIKLTLRGRNVLVYCLVCLLGGFGVLGLNLGQQSG